jgi:hypothetical protein
MIMVLFMALPIALMAISSVSFSYSRFKAKAVTILIKKIIRSNPKHEDILLTKVPKCQTISNEHKTLQPMKEQ